MKKNDKGVIITEQQGYGSSITSKNTSVAKDEQRFKIIHIDTALFFCYVRVQCFLFKIGITLQDVKD